ncbi:hypothetical protein BACCOPRO_03386 [Phocaeicola coprophilus DSM 18228 = JCM 13818]|uniref:Uncharacterized protein n=1 Tax=Phocaeicola coprophilus DSM 18228 = JCM 13818 TaxID=547042 RepID=S0FBM0_9BACT|nr:hypothetical protein BACCOPRO_03386 [Phocaeicola coprophilus DSM 18228 = JCM 13818]
MPGSNEDCFSVLPEKEQEAKNRKDRKIPEFLIISEHVLCVCIYAEGNGVKVLSGKANL